MRFFVQIGYSLVFSRTVWRSLHQPPEHPVFWRIFKQNREYRLAAPQIGLLMLVFGGISYSASIYLSQFNLYLPVFLLVVKTVLSSSIIILWVITISMTIANEYQQATYDLICVAPSGALGANWSLATGILHRDDLFGWVNLGQKLFSGLILLILLMTLIPIEIHDGNHHLVEFLLLFSDIVFLAIFTYIEHVHTVVLGVLVALLIPQFIHHITIVHMWSAFVFAALKITMLALFLTVSLFVPHSFSLGNWQLRSIVPQFLLLYAMHECCIRVLWTSLSHQFNTDIGDLVNLPQETELDRVRIFGGNQTNRRILS